MWTNPWQEEDDGDEEGQDAEDEEPTREVRAGTDVDAGEVERTEGVLAPQDIDAFWLQRRVAAAFPSIDAAASQQLAEQVFTALQVLACVCVRASRCMCVCACAHVCVCVCVCARACKSAGVHAGICGCAHVCMTARPLQESIAAI